MKTADEIFCISSAVYDSTFKISSFYFLRIDDSNTDEKAKADQRNTMETIVYRCQDIQCDIDVRLDLFKAVIWFAGEEPF